MVFKDMTRASYCHCNQKVGLSLVEPAHFGHDKRGDVRYECLYDKDNGDDCKVGQLVGGQLRCELCEN
jgi:hypothetical protein